jgi:hypothetical protein
MPVTKGVILKVPREPDTPSVPSSQLSLWPDALLYITRSKQHLMMIRDIRPPERPGQYRRAYVVVGPDVACGTTGDFIKRNNGTYLMHDPPTVSTWDLIHPVLTQGDLHSILLNATTYEPKTTLYCLRNAVHTFTAEEINVIMSVLFNR